MALTDGLCVELRKSGAVERAERWIKVFSYRLLVSSTKSNQDAISWGQIGTWKKARELHSGSSSGAVQMQGGWLQRVLRSQPQFCSQGAQGGQV